MAQLNTLIRDRNQKDLIDYIESYPEGRTVIQLYKELREAIKDNIDPDKEDFITPWLFDSLAPYMKKKNTGILLILLKRYFWAYNKNLDIDITKQTIQFDPPTRELACHTLPADLVGVLMVQQITAEIEQDDLLQLTEEDLTLIKYLETLLECRFFANYASLIKIRLLGLEPKFHTYYLEEMIFGVAARTGVNTYKLLAMELGKDFLDELLTQKVADLDEDEFYPTDVFILDLLALCNRATEVYTWDDNIKATNVGQKYLSLIYNPFWDSMRDCPSFTDLNYIFSY